MGEWLSTGRWIWVGIWRKRRTRVGGGGSWNYLHRILFSSNGGATPDQWLELGEARNKTTIWSGTPQVSRRNPEVSGITVVAPPPACWEDHTSTLCLNLRVTSSQHHALNGRNLSNKRIERYSKRAWLCLQGSLCVINIFSSSCMWPYIYMCMCVCVCV